VTDQAQRGAQILCVEDEIDFLENITEELTEAGFSVLPAQSAEQALTLLQTHRPDLILCDVAMPGTDGYALLEHTRSEHPHLADVPFVFLTAHSHPEEIAAGKWAGVDDYLIKPVDFDLLLATLHARLRQVERIREQHGNGAGHVHEAMAQLQKKQNHHGMEQVVRALDHVNFGLVLIDASGKIRFMNRMAQRIVTESPGLVVNDVFVRSGSLPLARLGLAVESVLAERGSGHDYYECVSLSRPDSARDLLCMVCALPLQEPAKDTDIAISVIVSDPSQRHALAPAMLETLFNLTPTEANVATAFAQGMRSVDIARQFDISPTTVAFHKRNLFEKTQTHRQADLVALLLSLPVAEVSPSFER